MCDLKVNKQFLSDGLKQIQRHLFLSSDSQAVCCEKISVVSYIFVQLSTPTTSSDRQNNQMIFQKGGSSYRIDIL